MQDRCPDRGGRLYGDPGHCGSHLHHEILSLAHTWDSQPRVAHSSLCVSKGCWQNCKEFAKELCSEDVAVENAVNGGRTQND